MKIETFQLTENERSDSSRACQALDFHCFRDREETSQCAIQTKRLLLANHLCGSWSPYSAGAVLEIRAVLMAELALFP